MYTGIPIRLVPARTAAPHNGAVQPCHGVKLSQEDFLRDGIRGLVECVAVVAECRLVVPATARLGAPSVLARGLELNLEGLPPEKLVEQADRDVPKLGEADEEGASPKPLADLVDVMLPSTRPATRQAERTCPVHRPCYRVTRNPVQEPTATCACRRSSYLPSTYEHCLLAMHLMLVPEAPPPAQ